MPNPQVLGAILGIVGIILVVIGYTQSGVCAGGLSLILFGVGALAIGGGVRLAGGPWVLLPASILGIILLGAGLYVGGGAGCGF